LPELWDFIAWKIVGHWCVPKLYNYMAFQPFDFERTWWRLFWAYLMKVILSVPDEGYFEHTWWRLFWAYLMTVILSVPDEGYFERTWWRLFWVYLMKVILSVPDEGYFECTWWRLFWAYLMKGYFRKASCTLDLISTFFYCMLSHVYLNWFSSSHTRLLGMMLRGSIYILTSSTLVVREFWVYVQAYHAHIRSCLFLLS
jgi:hypothetical protein